jgi:hypothetical protein
MRHKLGTFLSGWGGSEWHGERKEKRNEAFDSNENLVLSNYYFEKCYCLRFANPALLLLYVSFSSH